MTSRYSCRVCLKPTLLKKLKAIFGDAGEIANKIYITTGVQVWKKFKFSEIFNSKSHEMNKINNFINIVDYRHAKLYRNCNDL